MGVASYSSLLKVNAMADQLVYQVYYTLSCVKPMHSMSHVDAIWQSVTTHANHCETISNRNHDP